MRDFILVLLNILINLCLELHALIQDKSSDNDLEKSEQEARYIAEQVKYIIEHKQVYDMKSETYRQATFKDIVILERG